MAVGVGRGVNVAGGTGVGVGWANVEQAAAQKSKQTAMCFFTKCPFEPYFRLNTTTEASSHPVMVIASVLFSFWKIISAASSSVGMS